MSREGIRGYGNAECGFGEGCNRCGRCAGLSAAVRKTFLVVISSGEGQTFREGFCGEGQGSGCCSARSCHDGGMSISRPEAVISGKMVYHYSVCVCVWVGGCMFLCVFVCVCVCVCVLRVGRHANCRYLHEPSTLNEARTDL